ncbi:MAG: hypothetical protein K2H01_01420, partial [Ruminococcus sp.]|nr:hypothetical protein [Ruminococcus sp.]
MALTFGVMMTGCIGYYSEMSRLTDDDLSWIEMYEEGDTLLYESELNEIDTIVVGRVRQTNRNNPFYIHFLDDYKGSTYEAYAGYFLKIAHSNKLLNVRVRITKLLTNDNLNIEAYFGGLFSRAWESEYDYGQEKRYYKGENPIKIKPYRYKDKIIENCIVFDKDNSRYSEYYNELDSVEYFVISKDYGLLSYKFTNSTEYTRKE